MRYRITIFYISPKRYITFVENPYPRAQTGNFNAEARDGTKCFHSGKFIILSHMLHGTRVRGVGVSSLI